MPERPQKPRSHDGAPSAELGVAKLDLPRYVRDRLDNLQMQVTRILEKYGISSFDELKALGEIDSKKIDVKDIERLTELTKAIAEAVKTKEVHLNDTEVEIPLDDLGSARNPEVVDGEIVFAVITYDGNYIYHEDGPPVSVDKDFDFIADFQRINGRLVFAVECEDESFIATEDGSVIGRGKGYNSVDSPMCIDGKIAFRAWRGEKTCTVMEDGTEIEGDFQFWGYPKRIGDKDFERVQRGGEQYFTSSNGDEIGKGRGYVDVRSPSDLGGKIGFLAKKENDNWVIVDHGGNETEINKDYNSTMGLVEVGGAIFFGASDSLVSLARFIANIDGSERWRDREYDRILYIQDIGGMVAFIAEEDRSQFIVIDGEEFGVDQDYYEIFDYYQVNPTQFAVIAGKGREYVRHIYEIPG